VALGCRFTVVLSTAGEVFVFGEGKRYVLGTGSQKTWCSPVKLALERITKVSVGWTHTLALTDTGQVYTWGDPYQDLSQPTPPIQTPTLVAGLSRASDIAAGVYHSAVLVPSSAADNEVWVWGDNSFGQLGCDDTSLDLRLAPKVVPGITGKVVQLEVGGCSTYAITADYQVYAWGSNKDSQFGPGLPAIVKEPTLIYESREHRVHSLSAGYSHVLLIAARVTLLRPKSDVVVSTELSEMPRSRRQPSEQVTLMLGKQDDPNLIDQV
jgi:alpha-tubulin suppressor-like RCC1 family protein